MMSRGAFEQRESPLWRLRGFLVLKQPRVSRIFSIWSTKIRSGCQREAAAGRGCRGCDGLSALQQGPALRSALVLAVG